MKYRKKPIVIEAVQFHETICIYGELVAIFITPDGDDSPTPEWMAKAAMAPIDGEPPEGKWYSRKDGLIIGTLEGHHFASPGDWIIRGIKGEIYPCKPEIFAATYEPA